MLKNKKKLMTYLFLGVGLMGDTVNSFAHI